MKPKLIGGILCFWHVAPDESLLLQCYDTACPVRECTSYCPLTCAFKQVPAFHTCIVDRQTERRLPMQFIEMVSV